MELTKKVVRLLPAAIAFSILCGCGAKQSANRPESTQAAISDSSGSASEQTAQTSQVSIWAGTSDLGCADGANLEASFIKPYGLTPMADGSILIVDSYANLIRASHGGLVTSLAGNTDTLDESGYPLSGYLSGAGSVAILNRPRFAAVSAEGVIVFSDTGNHRIRVIKDGVVRLLAGNGTAGFLNGDYMNAQFDTPSGIAIGADGTIYVADTLNHCIRSISPGGQVSTLAGTPTVSGFQDGGPSEALFCEPNDIQLGPDGALYVVDKGNQRIRKITRDQVTTVAGSGDSLDPATGYVIGGYADGDGSQAQFLYPTGLFITEDGTIYLADTGNHCIRKITADHQVTTVAGSKMAGNMDGSLSQARFNQPTDVLYQDQILYVSDSYNHVIRAIQLDEEGE